MDNQLYTLPIYCRRCHKAVNTYINILLLYNGSYYSTKKYI